MPRLVALLVPILALALSGAAHAQVFETVGARALGMGGAFVAVADDATANYWNPAGLTEVFFSALLEVQRADTRLDPDPTRRQGTRDLSTFASLATPTLGLTYYRLGSRQVERMTGPGADGVGTAQLTSLVPHHAGLTLVQPLLPGVTVATVVKAVRGTAAMGSGDALAPIRGLFDQASELGGQATTRFDLDVGVMVGLGALRLGLVGRNLREPEFTVSEGVTVNLRRQVRAGLAVRPTQSLVVSMDADLRTTPTAAGPRRVIAVGAEQRLGWLIVRAGGRVNVEADDPQPVGALGASLEMLSGLWLDGHVTGGRDDGDKGWGISTRVGL